jgi:apolipoprotein N-acyltransferase
MLAPLRTPLSWALDRHRLTLAFLAGLALALSFPKAGFFWLAWLVPGFLVMLSVGQSGGTAFRIGLVAGLGNWLCSLYWLLLIPLRLHAFAAWVVVSMGLALFYGAWCWVCWWNQVAGEGGVANSERRTPQGRGSKYAQRLFWAAFCAAAWVAMEFAVTHLLCGFPWNLLGSSQYRLLPLIQIASVTGIAGISFIMVWMSVAGWAVVCVARPTQRPKPFRLVPELAVPLIVLAAVLCFGYARLAVPDSSTGHLKVALVQPSIPQSIIWDVSERTNRVNKLKALSLAAFAQHPDLLVWPEAALPPNLVGRNRDTQDLITSLVRTGNVWMVFGGIDTAARRDGSGGEHEFNAAFFVDPAGELVSRYFKRHLVPFGEYMPGARWFPFLRHLRKSGAGVEAGQRPVTFELKQPRARIAPLICYEDVFPGETRESVDEDTDFLLNLTNNGWFGASAAQWQHAASALFRAVENGLPLVRCTNNGLTCWVDPRGRLHNVYFPGSSDIYQAGFKIVEIPLRNRSAQSQRTFYYRYGDVFGWSCVTVVVGVLTLRALKSGRWSRNPKPEGRGPKEGRRQKSE